MKAVKYALFALLATCVNLLVQLMSLAIYDRHYSLIVAMLSGTFAGLVVKYIFDKRYIFNIEATSTRTDLKQFYGYSLTGVFTTLLFWTFELSFDYIFEFSIAKYLGATVGLGIGYYIKYQLDKTFVFRSYE